EPRRRAGLADESSEVAPRLAIAVAAQVDARQDDLAMALRHTTFDLVEDRRRRTAARFPTDQRDDAEVARETATILDLHECPHTIESRVGLHAADGANIAGDGGRRVLAAAGDDDDVVGETLEAVRGEVGAASGHVDALVRSRGARRGV